MKLLSLKLPDGLARKLAAAVKRRGAAKSDVVREALARYLADAPEARRGSVLDLAGDLVGCVKDADLSSNPRHLDDFGR
jgi:Arc/MetJ-type ribon-helix-helix transcriptional regulator